MRAGVGGIERQRLRCFVDAGLQEAEVVVDQRQAGAAGGAVRIEQQARAIDGAVVVELDRRLQVRERLARPVLRSACGSRRRGRPWGRAGRAPWRSRTARRRAGRASPRSTPCRDRRAAARRWDRGPTATSSLAAALAPDRCSRIMREAEAEARQRIGRIQRDRALERGLGLVDVDPGQRRRSRARSACARAPAPAPPPARPRPATRPQLAEHLLQLGKPRPGERVLRVALDRLAQRRARRLELEVAPAGRRTARSARALESGLSSTARRASASACCLAVLHHLDDRALGQRLAGIRVERERPLDRRCRLVHPADVQEHAGPIGVVARIARRLGHGLERGERAGVVVGGDPLDRGLQPGRQRAAAARRRRRARRGSAGSTAPRPRRRAGAPRSSAPARRPRGSPPPGRSRCAARPAGFCNSTWPSSITTSARSAPTRTRNSVPSAAALTNGVSTSSARGRWLKK